MRFTKKTKTILASVQKGFADPTQANMQPVGHQANSVPQSDIRLDEVRRKPKSGSQLDANMQSQGPLGRPVSTATSFNTGPPVPPHKAPSFSVTNAPADDALSRAQPVLTRKPTYSDGLANNCPKSSERPLPPPRSTMNPAPPVSEHLLMGASNDHEPLSQGLAMTESSGEVLSQSAETQPHDMEITETPAPILDKDITEQSVKIQERDHKMEALLEANSQYAAEVNRLEDELRKEKERHNQTTQAWRKAAAALSANRPEANYKVDDDTLRKDYQNIIYDVSSWVASYCVPNFDHVPESELWVFDKLTLHPHKYYHYKRTRELLLQSLVMHDLVELVLNGRLWWAGKQSGGLCMIQFALEPDEARAIPNLLMNKSLRVAEVRDYSAWKAKTALLLSEKVNKPTVHANAGSVVAEMQKLLKPFVQRTMPAAWKELEVVILKAIALDHELNKSRALFQVHRWSAENLADMQFDEASMATPNGLKAARCGMKVELILAPLITKTGNADGEAFESLSLISPWVVVCYENRKQMQKK